MIPRREENEEGGPCFTALAAFASLDSSITASSEAEGMISCGGVSSTVVAILFYFLGGKKIEMYLAGGRYVIHVIYSAIRHVTFQWPPRDWIVGRMDPEPSEVEYRNGD